MSQVNIILQALSKLGVATYDDLEAEVRIPRNKLRWSCNTMKSDGHIKQTEDPLTKEVAWTLTPSGRLHMERQAEDKPKAAAAVAVPTTPAKKAGRAVKSNKEPGATKPRASTKSNGKLQTTPAEGGVNIIRRPESDSPVGAATTSSEVRAVVEQPGADAVPLPAGSDVVPDFRKWAADKLLELEEIEVPEPVEFTDPQLFAMISIDGTLHISFAGKEVNLPAFAVRQLGDFLADTEPAWI